MRSRLLCGIVVALAMCLPGCPPTCPKTMVPLGQLVSEYNANASGVGRLWARAKISVTIVDESGLPFTWSSGHPNGRLMLAKGDEPLGEKDFRLSASESGTEVFCIGIGPADANEYGAKRLYYCSINTVDVRRAWVGRPELAGAPGVEGLPIDPMQLLAVLGVCELPEDFTKLPTVAMSMSKQPYAYVVSYMDRQPLTGRVLFRREMWFRWGDELPRRPFEINFFDTEGRRVLTAKLKDYKPIEIDGDGEAPIMPTDIELTPIPWPWKTDAIRRIHIVLSEMSAIRAWRSSACRVPRRAKFGEIIDVDATAGRGAPK